VSILNIYLSLLVYIKSINIVFNNFLVLSLNIFKLSLFDFILFNAIKVVIYKCLKSDDKINEYFILNYFYLILTSLFNHFTVAGQTKKDFFKELFIKIYLNIYIEDSLIFNIKLFNNFNDENNIKTFNKYVTYYD
jgi:hypothetical protein